MGISKQSERAGGPPKAVSTRDALQAIRIAAIAILAWITPPSGWRRLSVVLGAIDQRIRPDEMDRQVKAVASKLGDRSPTAVLEIVRDSAAAVYEDRLQLLREYRPGGWQPHMDLVGEEHL